MKFNRSIKKCESWVACAYSADKGTIGFEHHSERKVLYQYVYYGSAKIGKPFISGYRLIDQKGELFGKSQRRESHHELVKYIGTENPFFHSSVMMRKRFLIY